MDRQTTTSNALLEEPLVNDVKRKYYILSYNTPIIKNTISFKIILCPLVTVYHRRSWSVHTNLCSLSHNVSNLILGRVEV